jgi:hypothetical protein
VFENIEKNEAAWGKDNAAKKGMVDAYFTTICLSEGMLCRVLFG